MDELMLSSISDGILSSSQPVYITFPPISTPEPGLDSLSPVQGFVIVGGSGKLGSEEPKRKLNKLIKVT